MYAFTAYLYAATYAQAYGQTQEAQNREQHLHAMPALTQHCVQH